MTFSTPSTLAMTGHLAAATPLTTVLVDRAVRRLPHSLLQKELGKCRVDCRWIHLAHLVRRIRDDHACRSGLAVLERIEDRLVLRGALVAGHQQHRHLEAAEFGAGHRLPVHIRGLTDERPGVIETKLPLLFGQLLPGARAVDAVEEILEPTLE